MLLQAALNGALTKSDHHAVPMSVAELAHDAVACVAAGAGAIHLHPRDADGRERFDRAVVDGVALAVREAAGVPVGVSTGAWIEPDIERRVDMIRHWRAPDYASVNISEDGSNDVMRALLDAGIGIEAGVWSVEDAERLAASGLGGRVLRLMIEPVDASADAARGLADEIHDALDPLDLDAPRLQHGDGDATWAFLTDAVLRGVTRASASRTPSTSPAERGHRGTRRSLVPPVRLAPARDPSQPTEHSATCTPSSDVLATVAQADDAGGPCVGVL